MNAANKQELNKNLQRGHTSGQQEDEFLSLHMIREMDYKTAEIPPYTTENYMKTLINKRYWCG